MPAVPLTVPASLSRRDRRRVGAGSATTDRVNRILLGLVGLVVAGAGIAILLLGNGAIHWSESPGSLYHRGAADAAGAGDLAAAIAVGACALLALLGLRWSVVQLRPVSDGPRLGTVSFGGDERGRTTFPAVAVARAAGADLANRPGISSARVRLLSVRPVPRAVVVIEMAIDAKPDEVMAETSAALGRLAQALGAPTVHADLRVRIGSGRRAGKAARVR